MTLFEFLPITLQQKADSLNIQDSQIVENFIKGTGKGGQKLNKTSSTVYLKHIPTGIEVKVNKHRERSRNRISALKLLILKIESVKLGKQSVLAKKIHKLKKQKQKRSKRAQDKILAQKHQRSELKQTRKNLDL